MSFYSVSTCTIVHVYTTYIYPKLVTANVYFKVASSGVGAVTQFAFIIRGICQWPHALLAVIHTYK